MHGCAEEGHLRQVTRLTRSRRGIAPGLCTYVSRAMTSLRADAALRAATNGAYQSHRELSVCRRPTLPHAPSVALETRSAATQSAPCVPCLRTSFLSRLLRYILFLPMSTVRARTPSRVHPAQQPQEPAHVFLRIREESFRREHAFIERLIGLAPVVELGRCHHLRTETSRPPDL